MKVKFKDFSRTFKAFFPSKFKDLELGKIFENNKDLPIFDSVILIKISNVVTAGG